MSKAYNYRKATGGPNATFFQAVTCFQHLQPLYVDRLAHSDVLLLQLVEHANEFSQNALRKSCATYGLQHPTAKGYKITVKPYAPQGDVTMKTSSRTEINFTSWVAESNWTLIETMSWTSAKKF